MSVRVNLISVGRLEMADEYVVERKLHVAAPPSALDERIVDLRRGRAWSLHPLPW